ncbi:unnamed protein product [Calicophoron daubneyi]|uniref:NEDD8-activating enzyme E1 regulatory subunit n=1 Tax=Calicophoron daubneyi TaxID=300641 RepID=A0AAV2TGM3_CALDB
MRSLWGDHGQCAIEDAKVCLIRAGATGSEILKNLVLPGIGSFTIVDDACVCEEDLGCNFFWSEDARHKPRAQVVTEYLSELNESVSGNYVVENFADLIENDPQFFLGFTLIIVTDARERPLIRLSRILRDSSIPVVICISVGVVGYLRVSASEHVIVESHPDASRPDLRLDQPLDGLIKMANEMPLEDMTSEQLAHTPWLIIVHIFVQKFIETHGHFPQNFKEKTELKGMILKAGSELIKQLRKRELNLESSFSLENFQEACRAVNTAVCPTEIPPEVRDLLEDERSNEAVMVSSNLDGSTSVISKPQANTSSFSRQSSHQSNSPITGATSTVSNATFWRLICAMHDFVQHEGCGQLPVRGSLPDMTSDSQRYLRLLSIYRERSEWAVERLAARLTQFPDITRDDIRVFVKNAAFLRVVRCRSLEEEMKLSPARSDDLALIPTHEENDAMLWYLVLRGASSFLMETGRWPGSVNAYTTPFSSKRDGNKYIRKMGDVKNSVIVDRKAETDQSNEQQHQISYLSESHIVESDLPSFRSHLNHVLRAFAIAPNRVSLDYVNEFCRFGGGELHSVAAFMGGIAAQEVVKLITHQFVPVTKPLIYNAITQRTELLDF